MPGGFSDKSRKSKPVIVAVVLEISKGEEEKGGEPGRGTGRDDAIPHRLGMAMEQRGLVC